MTRELIGDTDPESFARGKVHNPHGVLGAHAAWIHGEEGVIVRAFHPDANGCVVVRDGLVPFELTPIGDGMFAGFIAGARLPLVYRLRFYFPNGEPWERDDPYRFLPTLGEVDLHLIGEGTHRKLWRVLGASTRVEAGTPGTAFAVLAPNARSVALVGDFNRWDGRLFPMRSLGSSGVWELFVPGIGAGALYKFEIRTQEGELRVKTDPLAREMEHPPATASRVNESRHVWGDAAWMEERGKKDPLREPSSIYELHLGSWARVPEAGKRWLT